MTNTKMITRLLAAATLTAASITAAYAVPQQEGAMAGVGTAATATDSALSKKVQAALSDYKGVGVTAAQGVVTLTGQVANTDIGTKAIQAASAVEGVKEVKSELTVASK
ncbi:osmotic-shock protection protein [Massilia sp. Root418]|jgi:hyperosmotically inducible protein|uniref:BON domain-containing protein n=1 Tax=Massilia sp. Root418 TaxID=1736532 RepID=UPI0006FB1FF5|nr:BON domain-containing protein [Massilia sp. Root418]KQW97079.1 osmotic-shock protection protein [Massilia sp. Root418]